MDVTEEKAIRLRKYIEKLIHRFMIVQNRFLEKSAANLSNTELRIINFIGEQQRCIMREISDHLMIQKNNLTAIMDKLVHKEIVERERTDTDRRVVYVRLTEKGGVLYAQITDSYQELSRGMLNALPPEEHDYVLATLHKITEKLHLGDDAEKNN